MPLTLPERITVGAEHELLGLTLAPPVKIQVVSRIARSVLRPLDDAVVVLHHGHVRRVDQVLHTVQFTGFDDVSGA